MVAALLLIQLAHGEDSTWIADANGCRVWDPNPKPNETVTWTGPCVDGFAEGQGIVQWFQDGKAGSPCQMQSPFRMKFLSGL
jgi:hypothetical protein